MNLFELIEVKKLFSMMFALGAIQFIGGIASRWADARTGFIISGFVNGLVSSTAFTAALAKKSRSLSIEQIRVESISFLSTTLAMLLQGLFLIMVGTHIPMKAVEVFLGPIIITIILLLVRNQKIKSIDTTFSKTPLFDFISLVKLTIFIVGILTISKLLQIQFGDRGLEILTFLVSLFEIHGSIIANTQMLAKQTISVEIFCFLLSISISAAYISKVIMILFLGHPFLKKRVLLWTSFIIASISINAFAHGESKSGPHGGFIRMPGIFHTEVVPDKKDKSFDVFLLDLEFKNPSVKDSSVVMILEQNKNKKISFNCEVMGGSHYHCIPDRIYSGDSGKLILKAKRENATGTSEYVLPFK